MGMAIQSVTHKLLTVQDGLHRYRKFFAGLRFNDISPRTQVEGFMNKIVRSFLSEKKDSCVGCKFANAVGRCDSIQSRQTDIEQNEIRLQGLRLLDCIEAVL